jgi:hypothetical protein
MQMPEIKIDTLPYIELQAKVTHIYGVTPPKMAERLDI